MIFKFSIVPKMPAIKLNQASLVFVGQEPKFSYSLKSGLKTLKINESTGSMAMLVVEKLPLHILSVSELLLISYLVPASSVLVILLIEVIYSASFLLCHISWLHKFLLFVLML